MRVQIMKSTIKRLEERDASSVAIFAPMVFDPFVKAERQKNLEKTLKRLVKIVGDVDKCTVSKTCDTKEYVIRLIDSKGNESSLWLNRDNKVRTVTSY